MLKKRIIITIFVLGIILPTSFANANTGTVLSSHKYAWSSDVGYINFENVIVNDSALTGFAWSENTGWINFSPTKGGVYNDGNGHLSGFAWGEGLGWIDFGGVVISTTTGKFSGTATGDSVGTINFACPSYCDVKTDWSVTPVVPTSTPPVNRGGGSSSGRGHQIYINGTLSTDRVDSNNEPLIIDPTQSGILTKDVSAGIATVDIPVNNIFGRTVFVINENVIDNSNNFLVPTSSKIINGAFYDVYAIDENGLYVHSFAHPISITLPISSKQAGMKKLGLYWLNETNWKWVLIPDAVFDEKSVTFKVNHLTKFAIFSSEDMVASEKNLGIDMSLPTDKKTEYIESEKVKSKDIASSTKNILNSEEDNNDRSGGLKAIVFLLIILTTIIIVKNKKSNKK